MLETSYKSWVRLHGKCLRRGGGGGGKHTEHSKTFFETATATQMPPKKDPPVAPPPDPSLNKKDARGGGVGKGNIQCLPCGTRLLGLESGVDHFLSSRHASKGGWKLFKVRGVQNTCIRVLSKSRLSI